MQIGKSLAQTDHGGLSARGVLQTRSATQKVPSGSRNSANAAQPAAARRGGRSRSSAGQPAHARSSTTPRREPAAASRACKRHEVAEATIDGETFSVGDSVYVVLDTDQVAHLRDDEEDDCACLVCGDAEKEARVMLECDRCLSGCHLGCLSPPLSEVPEVRPLPHADGRLSSLPASAACSGSISLGAWAGHTSLSN